MFYLGALERSLKADLEPLFSNRYEREEAFLGLNLPIKAGNLQESLLQFVKDELLDGENSYYCEECGEKVRNSLAESTILLDSYEDNIGIF